jgi:DNA-binding transcriptional MerR regulator
MEVDPVNKLLERLRNDFQGSADALIGKAQELAKTLRLDQEGSEGNERLLRHYVSMGVVDKPSREGRDALYGFRHLLQFVAARRLLAEGFSLAKIAKYTAVVPTDALSAYLEKPDRTSEAELLVAAFRSEAPARSASASAARRPAAPRPLPTVSTGMGMVDVMHEMREMEQRVHTQLQDLQGKVHAMVAEAVRDMGSQMHVGQMDPIEFKRAINQLANLMNEAAQRFESMLQKPMLMIEKQIDQQRYLFEEAHKQKDFLEGMFGELLAKQRSEWMQSLDLLTDRLADALQEVNHRLDRLTSETAEIQRHMQAQSSLRSSNPEPEEGTA